MSNNNDIDRLRAGTLPQADVVPLANELEFLRYYYRNVQGALGPADRDINESIFDAYSEKTGRAVSDRYDHREEEEE